MLINSKNTAKGRRVLLGVALLLFLLIVLKVFIQARPNLFDENSWNTKKLEGLETPTTVRSDLYTEDLLTNDRNKIYQKDNVSLFLNNELGTPTLMAVYADSISPLERNGRFLVFIYLKDPTEWRGVNKKWDHILLTQESLVPVEKKIDERKYYIFKFRLEHPYFDIKNLKELEYVRHTSEFGRFEEVKFSPEGNNFNYPVSNTLQKLQLSIKSKNLEKISLKREEALQSGILITDDDDYVKAQITADGQENIDASVRLKGDWTDHLEHDTKWSYRIVPEGEKTVFGMRKFSIQHPKSRNYIWEWLFNKVVKDNDLTGLRYDFLNVDLKISNKDSIIPMGIMALEESFDKILIENNKRREGLILGFDESRLWDERKQVKDLNLTYPRDADVPSAVDLPIKVYNENKTLSSPILSKQFTIAKNLILGLRNGKLKLSDAFDVDKLALYIALSNLFGGHHGLHVENIRIYYNPVTNKLEPVSFDSNSGNRISELREYPIGIHDDIFRERLVQAYEKVSSQEFIDNFVGKYVEDLNYLALNLSGEFNDSPLDLSVLQHNANLIKKKIFPNTILGSSLISYGNEQMIIEIENFSEFPVILDGLVLMNGKSLDQRGKRRLIAPGDTINVAFNLKKSFNNAFVSKKNREGGFRYPKDLNKIRLLHHVLGSQAKKQSMVKAYTSSVDEDLLSTMRLSSNLNEFGFIVHDEIAKKAVFKSGSFNLDRTLYIPADYEVEVESGFNLNFMQDASIISNAPIFCKGTKNKPIHFFSKDHSGGGIFVSSTSKKSILKHTYFTSLSVPKLAIWTLSGAVNFNEAPVAFRNCVFEENRSEDALNIIRTTFDLDSLSFLNTFSDSFDGDFVSGSISNSSFTNSGNDGIDISGSNIELKNITIINPSDKGLSAGEGSTMNGRNISINGGEIAVVSKDLSRINLTDVTIENTRLAIAGFQKKSEFGPGIVDLKNVKFSGIEVAHLIEETSELIIDDVLIKEKATGVIDKMYGNEYGKSSR